MRTQIADIKKECDRLIEIERAKRIPKRISISFDWKFSKVWVGFFFSWLIATACIYHGIEQYRTINCQKRTIESQEWRIEWLNGFSMIVRYGEAKGGLKGSEISRLRKDYETPEPTVLKQHVYDVVSEYESGENIINNKSKSTKK
jgi:hypothetical protein